MLKQIVNEEGEIDFNTVIPMPKELEGTVRANRDSTKEEKDASEKLVEKYGSSLTPLHYVAARVYREIVELLVANDAGDSYYIFTANPQSLRAPQSMSTFAHG